MTFYMCTTCGCQYGSSKEPPDSCIICEDERQYVGSNGQQWMLLDNLRTDHKNTFTPLIPHLTSIVTEPKFGIGNRAHLVQAPGGNILWDCISLVDHETVAKLEALGSVSAIALSHPHYYSTIVDWSRAFGSIPIYIHKNDAEWVTRPDPTIVFWEGESLSIGDGLTLINCGGHFEGSAVLHWRDGAEGKGVMLTGDSIFVVNDTRFVTFMRSFPNYIPLPANKVNHIVESLEPYAFDQVYDAFGRVVNTDGKGAVKRSAERYVKAISGSS